MRVQRVTQARHDVRPVAVEGYRGGAQQQPGRVDGASRRGRVRDLGVLDSEADLDWTRRVYYALIGESLLGEDAGGDPDVLASRIIDTLLRGAGPR